MTIKAVDSGWLVDVMPGGRSGKRLRKTFKTKADALAWERHVQAKVQSDPEWSPPKKDARLLAELVAIWFRQHGAGLNDGVNTQKRLLRICEAVGSPRADQFTTGMFAEYRAKRISQGITANNMNREQAYMRAMFNELTRLGEWKKDNPLKQLRAFKIQERELTYLTLDQVRQLLNGFKGGRNKHAILITKVCLATGSRWGEAEALRTSQVRDGQIQFAQTKSSKTRSVPITDVLHAELIKHGQTHGEGERFFSTAWAAFSEAVERACLVLPAGQMTHVLRHTFASHFMMNGGNILALQRALAGC